MGAGDPCKGPDCQAVQPCPLHTRKGLPRKRARNGDPVHQDNVHDLFSKERVEQPSDLKPPGGIPGDSSKDPRNRGFVKQKLGKRWTQIHREVSDGMYTWDEFVESLDAEELSRGQLKAEDGTFRGRPPDFIPRQFFLACKREMFDRFNHKIQGNLEIATDELIRLAMADEMEPKDRARILQYLIERVVGKIPDRVEVAAADPWETIISDILTESPAGATVPDYLQRRQGQDSSP